MPESPSPVPTTAADLERMFLGRYPLVYLITTEEERGAEMTQLAAERALPAGFESWRWSVTDGLVDASGKRIEGSTDPSTALIEAISGTSPAIIIFRDLHPWLADPTIIRHLRDFYDAASGRNRFLILLSPELTLPIELKKEAVVIDMPPPTVAELESVLDDLLTETGTAAPDQELRMRLLRSLQGLTRNEASHILAKTIAGHGLVDSATNAIQLEKARVIRKEGILQFVPQDTRVEDVGGLENLKDWLTKRRKLFRDHAGTASELLPKGLLMMGISGCGKSLSVKGISHYWDLPLFRLDMTEVFSGAHGVAEAAFARGLAVSESLAPCILWIDEIEGGITGYDSGGGSAWRIFSTFLTWMQEKTAPVFVAATANRIDLLPAEILRKGRFDQIFFLDLPSEKDREDIFAVHLRKRDNDPEQFDLSILSRGSKGWNGAEIENCVVSGMVEAYAQERPLQKEDLYDQLSEIVPLSTTMAEQIKAIRSWAHDRALKAGR